MNPIGAVRSSTGIRRLLVAGLAAAGLVLAPRSHSADVVLMTNVADNALWSAGASWQGSVAPVDGDGLVFGTNVTLAALTVTNDLASFVSGPITFGADAVSYTLAGSAMTLGGHVTNLAPAAQALNLDLVLNADRGIHAAGDVTLAGAVSGGFGLAKTGGGLLTLSGVNTYSGATILNEGIVVAGAADVVGVSGALGSGGDITFAGGTLRYSAASAATDWSARFKNSASAIVLDTDGQTVGLTNVIDSSNTGGLTKTGTGTLRLLGAADNTFSGKTLVSGGTLVITNAAANPLGAAPGVFTADQIELRDGTLQISASREFEATRGLTISGSTGTISFAGVAGNTFLKLNAPVTGASTTTLTKITGTTELWLQADSSSTFLGTFNVAGGSTRAGHDGALGSGTISFNANARLSSTGETARVFTNNVEINVGGAANNNAAIIGQAATYTGAVTFLGPVTLKGTAAGGTRTFSTEVATTLDGAITEEQPDTILKKVGSSALTIRNTASYSGSTVLSNGVLRILESGELTATTNILVADGRTLVLGATDETVSKNSRINDASTLSFGGTSYLNLSAAANVNETVGAVSLSGRERPVFTLDAAAGAQADLTIASLVRVDPGQSLLVRGTSLGATPGAGTTHIFLTTPPALTGGGGSGPQVSIVPWILGAQGTTGSGSDFATYDATRGLRPLDATEYDTTVAGASPTRNVSLAGAETLAADQTVNALRLAGGTLTNAAGGTLTVTSGAVLAYDADASLAGGRLAFGAAEGAFHLIDEGADQARTVTVSAALSGTGGLSLNANNASSVLQLNSSSLVTGVAAFAGTVAVNGGQIRMGAANVLHGTPLNLATGTKVVLNGFSQTIGDLSGAGAIEDGASSGTPVLTVNQAANGTSSVVIATSGDRTIALTKIGNGVLTLTANQNLNGDVRIEGGGIILSGGGQLDDPNNVYLGNGGMLRLYNLQADLDNTRLKTGATVFMSGGTYSSGHDNGTVSPAIMQTTPLTLLAGANMVSNRQAASGQTSTLGFGSLSRSAGATIDFQGASLGANTRNRIAFTTAPTPDDGIIAGWAYVGNEFAAYDTTIGSVTTFGAYVTSAESAWVAADNVKHSMAVASTTTLTGNRTINTLNLVVTGTAGTDPVFALGGNALTIDAGGLILSGTDNVTVSTTAGGSLTVGPGADSLYELAARIASGRTLSIAAPIADNGANPVSIVKSGPGALQLNNAHTFSGTIYVNEGGFVVNNVAAVDADNAVVVNGGAYRINVATTNKSLAGEYGTVRPNNTTSRALTLSGTSGSTTFGGTIRDETTGVLTLNKNGASVQVLTGSNAYTGVTTVNGGLLQFGRRESLYAADPANWTTAKLDVNAGAALGFNVGGPGEFTASDLDLLLGLGTATLGFNNGAFAALDTTSGDFEYGSVIANPNGGGNALGLVKLGNNTLVLPGANTYGGGTLILAGTLQVGNGGSSGALGGGAVSNDADLAFNRSDAFTFANAIAGSGTLTMRGTGELTLPSANAYLGGSRLLNGTVVVGAAGALGTGGLTMGEGATAGALALSNASQTVSSLHLASNGEVTNRIHIGTGQSLDVAGLLTNDVVASGYISWLRLDGAGVLTVTNAGGLFLVGTHETSTSVIDMGALGGLSVDLQTGVFRVGPRTGSNGNSTNVVVLATNSTIVASLIGVGDIVQSTIGGSSLRLGAGANLLYADSVVIGSGKQSNDEILFDGLTGTLALSNQAGTGRANLSIGVNRIGTAVNTGGILDLRGHDASLYLGSVTNGGRTSNNSGNSAGYLFFDQGVLDATSLIVGLRAGSASGVMTGEVHIGGGTVNLGSVELARNSVAGGTATYGLLNLHGGTITMGGDILRGGGIGPATAALLMTNSATLDMGGFAIGSGASPIDVLQLESGTLKNVAEINGGAAWTKDGPGTLTLDGANAFGGAVNVVSGMLVAASGSALGTTAGGVTVATNATLALQGGVTITGEALTMTGKGVTNALGTTGALRNLSGSNTWAGTVNVTGAGDKAIASDAGFLNITGDVVNDGPSGNLVLQGDGDGAIGGVISGARPLFKSASGATVPGTWTLGGANTYSGNTVVAGGVLQISSEANLGTTPAAYTYNQLRIRGGVLRTTADLSISANRGVYLSNGGGGIETMAGSTLTVDSVITGAVGDILVKTGAGTLQLNGANTYAGPTAVSNGTLRVNGAHTGGGVISVYAGASLAGTGTVGAVTVAAGGGLAPGNSAGTLTVGDLTLDGGATLEYDLGTASDMILASSVVLGGIEFANFTFLQGVGFGPGSYILIDATSISGLGAGTTGTIGSYDAELSIDGGAQDLVLTVVPEPASLGLLGLCAVAALLRRRLRR